MTKQNCQLVIRDSLGQITIHKLKDGDNFIGNDASSDIRLLSEPALGPRHILLVPRYEDCWVSGNSAAPLRSEDGAIVDGRFVPWGSRLQLGSTHFELQFGDLAAHSKRRSISGNRGRGAADTGRESGRAPGRVHPILLMLALCAAAFIGFTFLSGNESPAEVLPAETTELFLESPACKSGNPLHRAQAAETTALAKSERSVFDSQDGVVAVSLFEEAAACYRLAGQDALANASAKRATALRESLLGDYKRVRLRLERAIEAGDNQVARQQVAHLQDLLRHQKDSETSHSLRRLALRLSRKN